jgi:hypothetical protein
MNQFIRLIAAASLAVSLHANAGSADVDSPLVWDCARAGVPSANEVTTHFGQRNPHQLQATQMHLRAVTQRACASGATTLHIVARPTVDGEARFAAIAAR